MTLNNPMKAGFSNTKYTVLIQTRLKQIEKKTGLLLKKKISIGIF